MMVEDFKREVLEWAKELGVSPKEIHVRKMARKWGCCTNRGIVIFSSDIMKEKFETRAKVIVHELLHLKYPNHGEMFESLLKIHLGKKGIKSKEIKL